MPPSHSKDLFLAEQAVRLDHEDDKKDEKSGEFLDAGPEKLG
jgi:hypothetical protein